MVSSDVAERYDTRHMTRGPGANEFVCGDGIDTVLDYNPAKGDIVSNDCEVVNYRLRGMGSLLGPQPNRK
jgi:hypothetical protein